MITRQISEFTAQTRFSDLPENALHILKLSLLDWLAVGIAGENEPVSQVMKETLLQEQGREIASVFGAVQKVPPRAAALMNGTISHALDYDDTHFMHVGHTSVVVFSAVIALAEMQQASGQEILAAALIGSEVACHMGHWLGNEHYNHGFHQTATAGAFGATAAAAHLLKLNEKQTENALGLVSTSAAGLKSQFGTMGKPYNAGRAASNGVEAVLLTLNGFEARADGLECLQGFADTHAAPERRSTSLGALGSPYVFGDVQHKFHACCHGLHAALECILQIQEFHAINHNQVNSIRIWTNPRWLKVCDIKAPSTGLEAKFRYRLTAAMVISGIDTASLQSYCHENCTNPTLVMLRDAVEVIGDADIDDMAAKVEVHLTGGKRLIEKYNLADQPSLRERESRVISKSSTLIGESHAAELWKTINKLESRTIQQFVDVWKLSTE